MIATCQATDPTRCGKVVPLSEAVEILDSRRVPVNRTERDKRPGPIPYFGATGQVGWIDDFLFEEELVLLGEDGAPFLDSRKTTAYLIRGKSWVNNHAHVLRAKQGLDNKFLMHFLNTVDYRPYVSGTTRLKLPQGSMRRIPVPVPPLSEQQQIVAAIETQFAQLDDAVAALERARTRLKRYRASVLKAACEGRLVPTEAELAREEGRAYEPASVLLERIAAERKEVPGKPLNNQARLMLDISARLALPEGWEWTRLAVLLSTALSNGRSVPDATVGFPVLRLTALGRDTVDLNQRKTGRWTEDEARRFLVSADDFLIARGNGSKTLVGRGALVPRDPATVAFPDTMIRVRTHDDAMQPKFLAYSWQTRSVREQIESAARTTAGIYKINQQDIASVWLPVPPLAEQERIVAEVERRMSIIEQMEATVEASLKRAAALRQSILRLAFQGQLITTEKG